MSIRYSGNSIMKITAGVVIGGLITYGLVKSIKGGNRNRQPRQIRDRFGNLVDIPGDNYVTEGETFVNTLSDMQSAVVSVLGLVQSVGAVVKGINSVFTTDNNQTGNSFYGEQPQNNFYSTSYSVGDYYRPTPPWVVEPERPRNPLDRENRIIEKVKDYYEREIKDLKSDFDLQWNRMRDDLVGHYDRQIDQLKHIASQQGVVIPDSYLSLEEDGERKRELSRQDQEELERELKIVRNQAAANVEYSRRKMELEEEAQREFLEHQRRMAEMNNAAIQEANRNMMAEPQYSPENTYELPRHPGITVTQTQVNNMPAILTDPLLQDEYAQGNLKIPTREDRNRELEEINKRLGILPSSSELEEQQQQPQTLADKGVVTANLVDSFTAFLESDEGYSKELVVPPSPEETMTAGMFIPIMTPNARRQEECFVNDPTNPLWDTLDKRNELRIKRYLSEVVNDPETIRKYELKTKTCYIPRNYGILEKRPEVINKEVRLIQHSY